MLLPLRSFPDQIACPSPTCNRNRSRNRLWEPQTLYLPFSNYIPSLLEAQAEQLVPYCLCRKWHPCDCLGRQLLTTLVKIIWKVFSISSGRLSPADLEMCTRDGHQNQSTTDWVSSLNKSLSSAALLSSECEELSLAILSLLEHLFGTSSLKHFVELTLADPTQGDLKTEQCIGNSGVASKLCLPVFSPSPVATAKRAMEISDFVHTQQWARQRFSQKSEMFLGKHSCLIGLYWGHVHFWPSHWQESGGLLSQGLSSLT